MFAKPSIISPDADKVLLCHPQWFQVIDEKNVHMKGQKGNIDKVKALLQWEKLVYEYKKISIEGGLSEVSILPGVQGLEDMVFAANQTFPFLDQRGNKKLIRSNMRHSNRQKEVDYYQQFFENKEYEVLHLPKDLLFEGMGDLLKIPGQYRCLCGHGFRTALETIPHLELLTDYEIIALELINPNFYHLDTCISLIDVDTILYTPSAFSSESVEKLKKLFLNCIEVPEQEASHGFALNMHVVAARQKKCVILQEGNVQTENILRQLNVDVIAIDTSEYIKSGGSVFCLKMMYY
jgi:N-dimethylarginine dimethylaminohydrolase